MDPNEQEMPRLWILQNTVLPLIMAERRHLNERSYHLEPLKDRQPSKICPHAPGTYCFFCYCGDCKMFFATKRVKSRRPEFPRTPRYSYMGLVNSMRAAAAKREEERQEKLQAERDRAAGAKSPKNEKVTKSPKKKDLRQSTKRRRM